MNFQRFLCLFITVILFLGFSGCGYTTNVTIPGNIKTIYVPNFKNSIPISKRYTYVSGLEIDITNNVIDRLIFDGNLKVVKEDEADAILLGEVIGYEQEAVRFDSLESVSQYRLFIVVRLTLKKRETDEILWQENHFAGDSEYFIDGRDAISERSAANLAIEDISKKIVDRIVEDW